MRRESMSLLIFALEDHLYLLSHKKSLKLCLKLLYIMYKRYCKYKVIIVDFQFFLCIFFFYTYWSRTGLEASAYPVPSSEAFVK